ncbi:MAG: hypothetical protein QQN41_07245 [Nitrosopumilus sp.]
MYKANIYKIFLASPNDVSKERHVARQIIQRWNELHSEKQKIIFQIVGWETHSYSSMEGRAQDILNKQILKDADFLVGIFWCRIGTPTGEHESGTIEEIKEHINAGKPAMLCFSSQPVAMESVDQDQYNRLMTFKNECYDNGLVSEYDSIDEFQDILYEALVRRVNDDEPFTGFDNQFNSDQSLESKISIEQKATLDIPDLSNDAKTLLLEAAQDPSGNILKLSFIGGSTLQTNGKQMLNDDSARERARWDSALNLLIQEDIVESVGYKGEIFKVTHYGYEVADLINNA